MPVPEPTTPPDAPTLKAALDAKRDMLARLPATEAVAPANLDASAAASIVSGSLRRILQHRDGIAAQFGDAGVIIVDDLQTLTYATMQACIEHDAADSASDLRVHHESVLEDHNLLVDDADALSNRKLIERSRIDAGRPIQGYRTTARSTLVLVALFREHWSAVEGKTPLTAADLDRIEQNAQSMLMRLDEREQRASRLPSAELRARALGVLAKSYGEVRRMIGYVRFWEDDADTIAPSLWSGRRRGKGDGPSDDGEEPTPVITGPNNGGGPFTS